MPLGGGILVDRTRAFDLIDRMRVAGPTATVVEQVSVEDVDVEDLRRSEMDARLQLARAEEEVSRLRRELDTRVAQEEVTRIAEERGREMLTDADAEAKRIVGEAKTRAADELAQAARVAQQQLEEADAYALQLLQRLDEQISLFLDNVRSGIAQLDERRGTSTDAESYTHEPLVHDAGDDEEDSESEPEEGTTRPLPWIRADD